MQSSPGLQFLLDPGEAGHNDTHADSITGPGVFVSRFREQLEGTWKGSPEQIRLYDAAGNLIQSGRWADGLFLNSLP